MKISKMYTGKRTVISFNGAFHGRTTANISVADLSLRHIVGDHLTIPDCHSQKIGDHIPHHILDKSAAILIEPVQGERGGYNMIDKTYMKYLRQVSKQYGIVLILDEIQSYLRTGRRYHYQYSDIEPDMLVIAKGLAGSLPLSVIITKHQITDNIPKGVIGGTFQGNALSMAVASEILDIIEDEGILDRVRVKGGEIMEELISLMFKNTDKIERIKGMNMMLAIEFSSQKKADKFFDLALNRDNILFMRTSYPRTLRIIPPLNISDIDISKSLECVRRNLTLI